MITHDVDEAIYLADKIVLMTNGPDAVLAEIVENPLPKDRKRTDFHKHPLYYGVRNHIIDFLITRSRNFSAAAGKLRSAPCAGDQAGLCRARHCCDDRKNRRAAACGQRMTLEKCEAVFGQRHAQTSNA